MPQSTPVKNEKKDAFKIPEKLKFPFFEGKTLAEYLFLPEVCACMCVSMCMYVCVSVCVCVCVCVYKGHRKLLEGSRSWVQVPCGAEEKGEDLGALQL